MTLVSKFPIDFPRQRPQTIWLRILPSLAAALSLSFLLAISAVDWPQ